MGRFAALKEQKQTATETSIAVPTAVSRSKRDNPAYTQLSAYIPKEKYLAFKSYAVGHDIEVSEALEEAIDDWMRHRVGEIR